ncbi:uncharacterized protein PHALS_01435 [Plasmopara halstedii]|uniref:Uncharacterized protein n=1 Tax=Plasmopara halstedii TaxID=4781 RepID=A0A0P1ASQ0_PLAHL|nr:uncharacterized protein PHALS_01435 [Plasmopara halstedii]CEG45112.1 hypothetical protein PHALS_01435 [Plasmopara halstedii]|eukprot:XP_024581481.1 hypothetical protein PHALS_01435 [Plasmopara halstedii]
MPLQILLDCTNSKRQLWSVELSTQQLPTRQIGGAIEYCGGVASSLVPHSGYKGKTLAIPGSCDVL